MWFQKDWVHDIFAAEGSDLFLRHAGYIEAAKQFYGAEVVEPQSVYVNLMAAIADGGPAHTDNPRFHGRDRTNTPMWLLRAMLWSGLFDRYEIMQATAIWWMNDVEGGGLFYWPNGPDNPPRRARRGHGQHGADRRQPRDVPPGRPDRSVRCEAPDLVTPSAELAPVARRDRRLGRDRPRRPQFRAPLDTFRVSVLWKADVYKTAAERAQRAGDTLSMQDVADTFNDDLVRKGSTVRVRPRADRRSEAQGGARHACTPRPSPSARCGRSSPPPDRPGTDIVEQRSNGGHDLAAEQSGEAMHKTLSFFKYNPRLSVDECERHYRTVHTPLIVEMFRDVPGYRAYQQGRVTSARAYAHNWLPPFAIEPEFHRVVELHWDTIPDLGSLGDAGHSCVRRSPQLHGRRLADQHDELRNRTRHRLRAGHVHDLNHPFSMEVWTAVDPVDAIGCHRSVSTTCARGGVSGPWVGVHTKRATTGAKSSTTSVGTAT